MLIGLLTLILPVPAALTVRLPAPLSACEPMVNRAPPVDVSVVPPLLTVNAELLAPLMVKGDELLACVIAVTPEPMIRPSVVVPLPVPELVIVPELLIVAVLKVIAPPLEFRMKLPTCDAP